MAVPARLFFGSVRFTDGQELLEFQYRFLLVLLAFGALATAAMLAGASAGPGSAPIPAPHLLALGLYTVACAGLWLALRGRPYRFRRVAWGAQVASMLAFASALAWVPGDELRILWVFLNVPAAYLLLGRAAGGGVTAAYAILLLAGNAHLAAPYSPNALATAVLALACAAAFFHACTGQTLFLYRRLREMAMQDALTGALNSRAYYAVCDRMIRAARRAGRPYSVLFIDLDHFKSINDTWGHDAGDQVLKAVAGCLTINLRRSDVLGRMGGEEFSVYLPDTDLAGARHLAEGLREAIEALMPWTGEQRLRVTASLGVAVGRADVLSMRESQQEADQAMYRAKAIGRNRVSAFGDEQRLAA